MPHLSPHASCLPPPLARACSQTIFTMRAGVYSRWNGVVVAASELVMFALPFAGGWVGAWVGGSVLPVG